VIARPSDAVSLDPAGDTTAAGAIVYGNIIEPLLVMKDGKIQPHLATKYEIISSTRVRFFLRQGVKFHDGTPFNAEAVKFTFDRAVKMPARWLTLFGPLQGAEVVDEHTVDVLTSVPYAPILGGMTMLYSGIHSPKAIQSHGQDYGRNPVGTGPFKFKEWKSKEHIALVRNEDYWGKKAYLDEAIFKVVPEYGARMMGLRTGDFDMVVQPNPAELPAFRKDPKFTVAETLGQRVFFVPFNFTQPPVDDLKVRHALNMAVNTKSILDNI
jgi:peptide/nickel transport system substrate-binding protein